MFGFPLLSVLPLGELTFEKLMEGYFGKNNVDLTDAKLLDTHAYIVNGIQYEQKVYRLKDNSIYVDTKHNAEASVKFLKQKLDEAVADQEFETAAVLRDKIKRLK